MKNIFVLGLTLIMFSGCVSKPIIKTQYVDKPVPIKCVKEVPTKPTCNNLNVWQCLEKTLIYMGALEIIVNNCKE